MTAVRTFPAGVPCWVDTTQPDPGAASAFYGALLGWSFTDALPPTAPGVYRIATLDGHDAAAVGSLAPGEPATWNTYIAVQDADATAAAVLREGGEVVAEPWDAGPGGGAMWRRPGYGDHLEATVDPDIRTRQAGAPPGFADVVAGSIALRPGEATAHWRVTFSVADRDEAGASAERLGARIVAIEETIWNRTVVVSDPAGAEFVLSQFTPPH